MYPLTNLGCHRLRRHHHHHLEVIQQISITCKQNMSYCKMTKICNYIIFELIFSIHVELRFDVVVHNLSKRIKKIPFAVALGF